MKIQNAIYRLSKLARMLDVDECQEDVQALNMAVDMMAESLRDEQAERSSKRKILLLEGHRGNAGNLISQNRKSKTGQME